MMTRLFDKRPAMVVNAAGLLLALVMLAASPLRNTVVIALLMLYAIGYLVVHRRDLSLARLDRWVIVLLLAYVASQVPTFVLSGYSSRYLSPGLHMAASIPIYLMLRHLYGRGACGAAQWALEIGVILGALGAAALALVQTQWLGAARADGFLYSINFGFLSTVLFGMALALALSAEGRYRGWLWLAAAAALVALMLSGTRGAMLAVPPILLVLAVCRFRRLGWRTLSLGTVAVVGLAFLSVVLFNPVEQRVASIAEQFEEMGSGNMNTSAGYRLQLWYGAWVVFQDRPLVGATHEEREAVNQRLAAEGEVSDWVLGVSRGHAHSQYFELLATGGLLGILALMAMLLVPTLYYLRQVLCDSHNAYALTGLVMTVAVALCGLTESLLQQEMIAASYAYFQVTLLSLSLAHSDATVSSAT